MLKGVCSDAVYRKTMETFVKDAMKKTIEISARIKPGWAIIAKRWVVKFVRNILNKTIEISARIKPGWAIIAKRWVVEEPLLG